MLAKTKLPEHEDRLRLAKATLLALGLYLILFLLMLGVRPSAGGPSAELPGSSITVQLEGTPQALSVSQAALSAAQPSREAEASRGSASSSARGASLASASQSQGAPANPFALPPGINLSGNVVAASSGALEANRVIYGAPPAAPSASQAQAFSPPAAPGEAAPSAAASGTASSNSAAVQAPSGAQAAGFGGGTSGELPVSPAQASAPGPAGGATAAGGGAPAAASGGAAASSPGPSVFNQSTLAQALGQYGAGYGGGGSASSAASQQPSGGGGPSGASAAQGSAGETGGFPIRWSTPGGREPTKEPSPLDLSKYADVLPPRTVVGVRFQVSPSGYVTPLHLVGSSGNTVVDSLLLGWMAQWRFKPVPGTQDAQGSLEYIIQATTAR